MARIRKPNEDEYNAWEELVLNYDPDITDPGSAWYKITRDLVPGLVVEEDEKLVAFMNYFLHDSVWTPGPICYLSDLYVKPEYRRRGIAKSLIDHLLDLAVHHDWERVYWVTEYSNLARILYDRYAKPEFVRYAVDLKPFV